MVEASTFWVKDLRIQAWARAYAFGLGFQDFGFQTCMFSVLFVGPVAASSA